MGSFKRYLTENQDLLNKIIFTLEEMDEYEINEFGEYLADEFLDIEDDDDTEFDIDDIKSMIKELGPEMYAEILNSLEEMEDEDTEDDEIKIDSMKTNQMDAAKVNAEIMKGSEVMESDEDLDEAVSRIMKAKNRNRKKRKFFKKTAADLRKTKAKRKRANRENKAKRKRHYRANKVKIAAYQKSRSAAIKKGKHIVKKRKKA